MPTLLQINTVINSGSTGHIAEELGKLAIANGWKSYIAYGRNPRPTASIPIKIGSRLDVLFHVLVTRLFDLHGLASRRATKRLVRQIEEIKPDVIHLHNIHGYYLNYKILFTYLAHSGVPVVWTMHDCWAATGHCPYYTFVQCIVWQTREGCRKCPQKRGYPKSVLFSNAAYNFKCKRKYFNLLSEKQLTLVCPSKWLSGEMAKSYLGHYRREVINNGIDLDVFKPSASNADGGKKFIILGVASVWDSRKGLADFVRLSAFLGDDEEIVLIGLSESQIRNLPKKIRGISRTENQQELVKWYSKATVFVNPTYEDNFPTTNIEAIACGTPVITYRVGGSPEIIDEATGFVVPAGDIDGVYMRIKEIERNGKDTYSARCIERAQKHYDKARQFGKYIELYNECIAKNNTGGGYYCRVISVLGNGCDAA